MGLLALVEAGCLEIGTIRFNPDPRTEGSSTWSMLIDRLDAAEQRGELAYEISLHTGLSFKAGDTHIEVLAPSKALAARGLGWKDDEGREVTANSMSAVVRFVRDDVPLALLPGDIDDLGLDWLLKTHSSPTAPVAVFPHHGGKPGSKMDPSEFASRFCDAVQPNHVVFSIGRGSSAIYPRQDIIRAVLEWQKDVHIGCTQMSRHCVGQDSDLPGSDSHLNPTWSRGRDAKSGSHKCCAGTIHVSTSATVTPYTHHINFIQAHVPNAICRL